nr:MAG TPA: hypothetical protein [Caudoviricetes sp.]
MLPVRYAGAAAIWRTSEATSSACPMRPAGISSSSTTRSSSESQAFISVSIAPGAIALTWMFEGASSLASAFVKALTPPLAAE